MARFEDYRLESYMYFTSESLYEVLDSLLEDIDDTILKNMPELSYQESISIKEKQLRSGNRICGYLSELYRRNLLEYAHWVDVEAFCSKCKKVFEQKETLYSFMLNTERPFLRCYECVKYKKDIKIFTEEECIQIHKNEKITKLWDSLFCIKERIKKDYSILKKVKESMISGVEADITKEINRKIDAILDSNGNKISELQTCLTSEHYRLIRAGYDISKLDIQEQVVLMNSLTNFNV